MEMLGKTIVEGKTKVVHQHARNFDQVILVSKDRITAGDGARAHEISGKAKVANDTTCTIFEFLNSVGIPSHFVARSGDMMVAKKVHMIPIECVARRVAYGSYLRRFKTPFPVTEAYRFPTPCLEFFYKDDANHDPQVTKEQLLSNPLLLDEAKQLRLTPKYVEQMELWTRAVFETLERAWAVQGCTLVDMKIEFGIDMQGRLILADVIDNDAWRVWPQGDRRLMKDKQFYRELKTVTDADLTEVLKKYEWVADAVRGFKARRPTACIAVGVDAPNLKGAQTKLQHYSALTPISLTALQTISEPTVVVTSAALFASVASITACPVLIADANTDSAVLREQILRILARDDHVLWCSLHAEQIAATVAAQN
ncbi:uncharacterized protein MONBRDRAFT_34384 [Monosiga brevicollis MX1]|uniref:SAICAR synthetase/ADE2 N-terminal domain-containing protein n=1 Tax=Monosiga brevicollis TaxID=81824 RepID=A9VBB9_MONBE|nr:uncharacterized protein MONBRDRAFT_34384 [Monosiga brevicollis MX1]EDQ85161.1 predicted protein [Monosiga brevicollis MX1]|eukprot:XP_001749986.1 hypothetical protein [Monosiga brevicollis MX1]